MSNFLKHQKAKLLLCSAAMILASAFSGCIFSPKFAEGTYFGSTDISGLSVAEAIPVAQTEIEKILANTEVGVIFAKSAEDANAETVSVSGQKLTYTAELEEFLKSAVKADEPQHLIPEYKVGTDEIVSLLKPASERFNTEPKNAKVTGFDPDSVKLIIDPAMNGFTANVEETAKAVAEAIEAGKNSEIDVKSIETQPDIKDEDVDADYVMLATYSTISTNTANGNHNMQLALSKINATVLEPGEVFSFNDKLGDSTTADSGFLPANIIVDGVITNGYGGGICQPSSTLYIAALYAGMEITERYCHMMPSSYVPIGIDATVSYGSADFKFKNVLDYPIFIYGSMTGKTVTTSIYGVLPDEWDRIEISSGCDATIAKPNQPVYIVDKSLAKNDVVLVSVGHDGYKASAKRTYYKQGVEVKTEALSSSNYSVKAATYKVGPGTDTSKIVGGKYEEPSPSPTPETPVDASPEMQNSQLH